MRSAMRKRGATFAGTPPNLSLSAVYTAAPRPDDAITGAARPRRGCRKQVRSSLRTGALGPQAGRSPRLGVGRRDPRRPGFRNGQTATLRLWQTGATNPAQDDGFGGAGPSAAVRCRPSASAPAASVRREARRGASWQSRVRHRARFAVSGSWLTKHFARLLQRDGLDPMPMHALDMGRLHSLSEPVSIPESLRNCSDIRRAERRWRSTHTCPVHSSGRPLTCFRRRSSDSGSISHGISHG